MNYLKNILKFPNEKQYEDIGVKPKNFEEVAKYWISVQGKINSNKKINFLKTQMSQLLFQKVQFIELKIFLINQFKLLKYKLD